MLVDGSRHLDGGTELDKVSVHFEIADSGRRQWLHMTAERSPKMQTESRRLKRDRTRLENPITDAEPDESMVRETASGDLRRRTPGATQTRSGATSLRARDPGLRASSGDDGHRCNALRKVESDHPRPNELVADVGWDKDVLCRITSGN